MRLLIVAAAVLLLLCPAWGQVCSNHTIRGTYGVVCTGFLSPAQGAPQVPFSALGTVTGDYSGVFQGTAKASIGGGIVTQVVKGTAVINSDCTTTITYTQTIDGQKAPDLHILAHILDQGQEIRGMALDPGSTMTCNLRLISR